MSEAKNKLQVVQISVEVRPSWLSVITNVILRKALTRLDGKSNSKAGVGNLEKYSGGFQVYIL